ncbi:transposase [Sorangium sp. So ce295]|uniref:transposase n=1 Tax=Sorangium sp. So ce295 TaxID=3133295 RepID=UPI003F5D8E58
MRYCSRPTFALDRIELLPDGRIAYLLKTPRRGRTHRVMSPMEFMARLAALIPPPKIPLVRYQRVFAPRSSWRSLVRPKPPARLAAPNGSTRARSNVGTDGVRVRRGVGGHDAAATLRITSGVCEDGRNEGKGRSGTAAFEERNIECTPSCEILLPTLATRPWITTSPNPPRLPSRI